MTAHAARRSAEEQERLDQALIEITERGIVFNGVLGLKVLNLRPAPVQFELKMRPDLAGDYVSGRLHGGVISATLDALGGFAVMAALADKHPNEECAQVLHRLSRVGTIDLRVDYLRQGLGQRFVASAEILRLGGRVASTQMRLVNDEGLLIATGAAAYIVS